jgi:DNA-binding transcriptional MocR family regulator
MLDLEQYQIAGRTAREIAASAEAAIRQGHLDTGAPLPTVRALAKQLGTSPATVNAAYRTLRQRGLVVADGRRGTRVAPRPALRTPPHARKAPENDGRRDLAIGLPDPALLPPLEPALRRIEFERRLRFSELESNDPQLVQLASDWFEGDGIDARSIAVVGGAFDGIVRVLQIQLRPGDRVIVEDPTYVSILDVLRALGLIAVPVPIDQFGFRPEPFARALANGVDAVFIVPRAQNPLGAALDASRAAELARLLGPYPDVLVLEDDHAALVSGVPFHSTIDPSRPRWAIVRSMSKLLHPDLRLAVMAGDETTVARVEGRQALGTRWVSHILQALTAELLADPAFRRTAADAERTYIERREALIEALAGHGLEAYGRSGLNVWVPVTEEAPVVRALHDAGWHVLAGERFRSATPPGIRITISTVETDEAAELAQAIADVEHARRPRRSY